MKIYRAPYIYQNTVEFYFICTGCGGLIKTRTLNFKQAHYTHLKLFCIIKSIRKPKVSPIEDIPEI